MRYTLLLFFLAFSFSSVAQEYEYVPFPTEGAVWRVDHHSSTTCGGWPGLCLTPEYVVIGDTIINDVLYHRMYRQYGSQLTLVNHFREDMTAKKIFSLSVCGPEFECLVYDFSLEVGDTLPLPYSLGGSGGSFHTVSSIDTIEMSDGTPRKKFNLLDGGVWNSGTFWIEGIGGNNGPFQDYNQLEQWSELRCLTQNEELIYNDPPIDDILLYYPGYQFCDSTIVGITDQPPMNNTITVYPNPAIEVLELKCNDSANQINAVTIFSIQGEQMHYEESTAPLQQVNVAKLPSEFYILKITTDVNRIRITKFMKL